MPGPVRSRAAAPRILVGTSGYNYAEWKGSFYPDKLPSRKMLPFYAERLPTVEINYTFYRMPTGRLLSGWSDLTPEHFRFTLKAPRRITHEARLRNCGDPTAAFCGAAQTLGAEARRSAVPVAAVVPAFAPRSSSVTPPGTTRRCSNGCGPGNWPCASPTAGG